ncbi:MAG: aldehyde dehydrogenase [Monoraphidium minutum]|nr:MAG: aldehyde dehydrogenase [Monoraphidium minutum]
MERRDGACAGRAALPRRARRGPTRHVSERVRGAAPKVDYESLAVSCLEHLPKKLLIGGEWRAAAGGGTLAVADPRTEACLAQVAAAGAADVDAAVAAARRAFDAGPWPRMSTKAGERGRALHRLADAVEAHADELAALETLDVGMTISCSRGLEVAIAADLLRYYAGWADKVEGATIPVDGLFWAYTLREPLGVVAAVAPFNFPLAMAAMKLAPALAIGNTVVLKARLPRQQVAEQAPLASLLLGELVLEAGLPPGVVNLLTGTGDAAGAPLVAHPGMDKVVFTGSTEVGRRVGQAAASNIKPCTLELGGKSPIIVAPDADVTAAVAAAQEAAFFHAGQCCTAAGRVYVHEAVHDEILSRTADAARRRIVGDPFDAAVQQGPQVDRAQFDRVLASIEGATREGAQLVAGGRRAGGKGLYIQPTVFAGVTDAMAVARDEVFGPVMAVMSYRTLGEVGRAHSLPGTTTVNPFGLAAGIFSSNADTVNTLTRALRVGMVWINCYGGGDSSVPIGGYKASGIGREKGRDGLAQYTQIKAVYQPLAPHL